MKKTILLPLILSLSTYVFSQEIGPNYAPPSRPAPNKADAYEILTRVDESASFPGGSGKLAQFLGKSLSYPQEAKDYEVQGKVIANFVVERDGSITDIKIKRDIGYGTGKEVIRVLKRMPKWIPAKNKGETVRSYYVLPVSFKLSEAE